MQYDILLAVRSGEQTFPIRNKMSTQEMSFCCSFIPEHYPGWTEFRLGRSDSWLEGREQLNWIEQSHAETIQGEYTIYSLRKAMNICQNNLLGVLESSSIRLQPLICIGIGRLHNKWRGRSDPK